MLCWCTSHLIYNKGISAMNQTWALAALLQLEPGKEQARAGQCDGHSVLNGKRKKHGPLIFILHISFTGTAFVLSDKILDVKVMASVWSQFLKHTLSNSSFTFFLPPYRLNAINTQPIMVGKLWTRLHAQICLNLPAHPHQFIWAPRKARYVFVLNLRLLTTSTIPLSIHSKNTQNKLSWQCKDTYFNTVGQEIMQDSNAKLLPISKPTKVSTKINVQDHSRFFQFSFKSRIWGWQQVSIGGRERWRRRWEKKELYRWDGVTLAWCSWRGSCPHPPHKFKAGASR